MLETVYFLILGIGAFVYIMFWSFKNDNVKDIDEQTGFLAMRKPDPSKNQPGRHRTTAAPAQNPEAPAAKRSGSPRKS
ncbi:MAG: hypothetical protein ACPGO3_08065 [Magnetospiraceae bacterium]